MQPAYSPWLVFVAVVVATLAAFAALRLAARVAASRLSYQSKHDPITQLPNRMHFVERLDAAIAAVRSASSGSPFLGVLLVDLDRFKIINDSLGHGVGDAVLQDVARRVGRLMGPRDLVARLGGDQFLVMASVMDVARLVQLGSDLTHSLHAALEIEAIELHLTASIGITTYPFDHSSPEVLISHADEAMHEVKREGGHGFRFFIPGTTIFTVDRLHLENDLRSAAAKGELKLHYQPQVEIASGRIVGLEALARWKHPVRGWIPPAEFIQLAEASDLISDIGDWILDEACRQTRLWCDAGFDDLSVSINLSARQFRNPDLLGSITRAVAGHRLLPRHIVIELTESAVMTDAERSIEILRILDTAGFRVSVDDFGTGYSSISYLKRLPISKLKIDQSFVQDLGCGAKPDAIVKAVIALAHGLGMTVVAEGVENRGQLGCLHEFGCDQYQGYVFSRPCAASEVAELLRRAPAAFRGTIDEEWVLGASTAARV